MAPLLNTTNTTTNNATDTNTTSPGSGNGNNRNSSTAWVVPIAVIVPLVFLCVVCIIWGRWVYKQGKKRYWQRVQNEHLMAYGGATEDSGQTYGIGELYENKYFASEQLEEINKHVYDRTIKGNEDEQRKSLPRQNSPNGKKWYEQTANHLTIPAATSSNNSQQDSGILSNRTSDNDNISDSTVVDKIDEENINVTLQDRNSDEEDSKHQNDTKETEHKNDEQNRKKASEDEQSKDEASRDEHGFEITITSKSAAQDLTTDKILTTDV